MSHRANGNKTSIWDLKVQLADMQQKSKQKSKQMCSKSSVGLWYIEVEAVTQTFLQNLYLGL